jgi:hypothetical protein
MDNQLLELCGRHQLTESLLGAGLEVAFPARDRGIDLIAYADTDRRLERFVAAPIRRPRPQHASRSTRNIRTFTTCLSRTCGTSQPTNTQIYVLTQREAIDIAAEMKYTDTESWSGKGVCVVTPQITVCRANDLQRASDILSEPIKNLRRTESGAWTRITSAAATREEPVN